MLNNYRITSIIQKELEKPFEIRKSWTIAIIVRGNRIICISRNTRRLPLKSTGKDSKKMYSYHAEYNALKRVKYAEGSDMYVVRLLKRGGFANAKPCINCQKIINSKGIKRVFFTE
jgi:deoxycytidylate deaminase